MIYFSEPSPDGAMSFPSVTAGGIRARDAFFAAACLALYFADSLEQLELRLEKLAADIQP